MDSAELIERIFSPEGGRALADIYDKGALERQTRRYARAVEAFQERFEAGDSAAAHDAGVSVFSAPGRTEVCGNHTDHQQGCVLAAAIDQDVIAVAAPNGLDEIRIASEGFDEVVVEIGDYAVREDEYATTSALVRGVCAAFAARGLNVAGFDAVCVSDVLVGSGLSSSAAFEVLVGTILNSFFNNYEANPLQVAFMAQTAETVHFGKPCGLMDQLVSALGGFVFIDFGENGAPKVTKRSFDFGDFGYSLFITNTHGSHAELTCDYEAVGAEMRQVAELLGGTCLREVDRDLFYARLGELREACSDRALLRAAHFFSENARVQLAFDALDQGKIDAFLSVIAASGRSSALCLQNMYSIARPQEQGIPLALLASHEALAGRGAYRVHGGGFAGTIQAIVPNDIAARYQQALDSVFGVGSCMKVRTRRPGGIRVAL